MRCYQQIGFPMWNYAVFYIRHNYWKYSTLKVFIDGDFVFPIFLPLSLWDKQWNLNSEGKSKGSRNIGQQALPIFVVSMLKLHTISEDRCLPNMWRKSLKLCGFFKKNKLSFSRMSSWSFQESFIYLILINNIIWVISGKIKVTAQSKERYCFWFRIL